jgi:hypothetical protein
MLLASSSAGGAIFMLLLYLALYVFQSYCIYRMAVKLNVPAPWMAWVPILNLYTMVKTAGLEGWTVILFLIPLVNIIFVVVLLFKIPPRLGKDAVWGLGLLVPVLNLFLLWKLAHSEPASNTVSV